MTTSLAEQAYKHIRGKLSNGTFVPGEQLVNRVLATEIGVSVIPVREAINRLATEGLVEHVPGSGAFVRQADGQQLHDLYVLRDALESCAAGEAAADAGSKDTCRKVLDRPFDRDYPALATALYIVGILYIFLGESRRARAQEDSGGEHPAPATSHVQELLVGGVTSDDEPLAAPAAQRYTHCIRSGVSSQAVRAT